MLAQALQTHAHKCIEIHICQGKNVQTFREMSNAELLLHISYWAPYLHHNSLKESLKDAQKL